MPQELKNGYLPKMEAMEYKLNGIADELTEKIKREDDGYAKLANDMQDFKSEQAYLVKRNRDDLKNSIMPACLKAVKKN